MRGAILFLVQWEVAQSVLKAAIEWLMKTGCIELSLATRCALAGKRWGVTLLSPRCRNLGSCWPIALPRRAWFVVWQ
jgi:hypothetical protein